MSQEHDDILKELETEKPTISKLDKKMTMMLINENNFLETVRKMDIRMCKIESQMTWGKGWVAGFISVAGMFGFFFVKMWNKVFP